jgi:hypothetical protein
MARAAQRAGRTGVGHGRRRRTLSEDAARRKLPATAVQVDAATISTDSKNANFLILKDLSGSFGFHGCG